MQSFMIGMVAETFIHAGIGQANNAIDLPVARERTTDYPYIPGSGVKGAFKSWAVEQAGLKANKDALFGTSEDGAGSILFSDARLLLLPVRSLDSAYVWLTCPLLLERLMRDSKRIGKDIGFDKAAIPRPAGTYCGSKRANAGWLTVEEREFPHQVTDTAKIVAGLAKVVPAELCDRLANQVAIVSNDDFAWFARYALPVMAHNQLNAQTKVSENLWYEETLPPDTVMYCLMSERGHGALAAVEPALARHAYCQFGGNETVGQGWFQLTNALK
jgi:CRISPR-associated protein Cmr4